jgi:hypothetical protein
VLGHAALKTTERYLHAIPASRLADAATRAFSVAPADDDAEAARAALRAAVAKVGPTRRAACSLASESPWHD